MSFSQVMYKRADVHPLRSASLNFSSQGIGTKTQFSGLGNTPTGELFRVPVQSSLVYGTNWRKGQENAPDVSRYTRIFAIHRSGIQGDMYGLMRGGFLGVKVLNQGGVCVEV